MRHRRDCRLGSSFGRNIRAAAAYNHAGLDFPTRHRIGFAGRKTPTDALHIFRAERTYSAFGRDIELA